MKGPRPYAQLLPDTVSTTTRIIPRKALSGEPGSRSVGPSPCLGMNETLESRGCRTLWLALPLRCLRANNAARKERDDMSKVYFAHGYSLGCASGPARARAFFWPTAYRLLEAITARRPFGLASAAPRVYFAHGCSRLWRGLRGRALTRGGHSALPPSGRFGAIRQNSPV